MRDQSKIERRDRGVAQVLLMRLENERLPFAIKLKEKVDHGELLSDYDLQFLKKVNTSAYDMKQMVKRMPQYEELVTKMMNLYSDIMRKHEENVQKTSSPG